MQAVNERELVERCRRGDERAFQSLVEAYQDLVFPVVARVVADARRAEALAEEVFVRVHRGLPYAGADVRLSTWIYRIIIDLCKDQPAAATGATADHGTDQRRDGLDRAIARLPAASRVLVAAYDADGVQRDALADAIGVAVQDLPAELYRARRQLRELVVDEREWHDRPAPRAPAGFSGRVLARIRRDLWRREQFFDAGFNVLVASTGVAITAGAMALVYTTGLAAVGDDLVNLVVAASVEGVRRLAPSLSLYAGAAGLIASALGVWWWAERDS